MRSSTIIKILLNDMDELRGWSLPAKWLAQPGTSSVATMDIAWSGIPGIRACVKTRRLLAGFYLPSINKATEILGQNAYVTAPIFINLSEILFLDTRHGERGGSRRDAVCLAQRHDKRRRAARNSSLTLAQAAPILDRFGHVGR
jgi:hypothetical protein